MIADLLTGALAEQIAAARQLRVFVPTTPATLVAARAAQQLGHARLAIASGFTVLDRRQRELPSDVFTLLRRGLLGVALAPAQLDVAGRTNLSGIGRPGRPTVALIGPRGLPDNNDTPSPLWYFLAAHSPRVLVAQVDVVCGAAPTEAGPRTLLTPAGCFDLDNGTWRARWLGPHADELLSAASAFTIDVPPGTPVRTTIGAEVQAALAAVDPAETRRAEFHPRGAGTR